ncbi:MAG: N-acetyltransferase [Propionibacteriaceae bacterium]|nr:family N-acetyltransferase [Propionibacteriaceae bacterium]MDX6321439.1 N-acetyltransferase [Propionibacteriaceae bacterium]
MDWEGRVPLRGYRLVLTPLCVEDAADYLAALGDPAETAEVTAHLSFVPPRTVAEAAEHILAARLTPLRAPYAQRLSETGELVGTTSFYEMDPTTRSLAIGHTWLARRYWRTGLNTESKLIMLSHAFEQLEVERVVWHTDIRNVRSQAAIERLGATKEGVLRHHRIRRDGSWRDTVQYSMLSAEWPAVKERLTLWVRG